MWGFHFVPFLPQTLKLKQYLVRATQSVLDSCSTAPGYKSGKKCRMLLIFVHSWGGEEKKGKKKKPLWLSSMSHFESESCFIELRRVFICEWESFQRRQNILVRPKLHTSNLFSSKITCLVSEATIFFFPRYNFFLQKWHTVINMLFIGLWVYVESFKPA